MAPSSRPNAWCPSMRPARTTARPASMGRKDAVPTAEALPGKVGRSRPVITGLRPTVDGGRYPAKGALGESVAVEADIFADGHDELLCEVRFRHEEDSRWQTAALEPVGNDRWRGEFAVSRAGRHRFAIRATIDRFGSWRRTLHARAGAGQPLEVELLVGAELVRQAAARAEVLDRRRLASLADALDAAASAGPAEGLE